MIHKQLLENKNAKCKGTTDSHLLGRNIYIRDVGILAQNGHVSYHVNG